MMTFTRTILLLIVGLLPGLSLAAGKTEITWYGHSAFKVVTPSGKVLLIDPWITNPTNKNGKEDIAKLDKVDLILITHGHGDHIGNSVDIAKKTGAPLVATFDLQKAMVQYRGYPKEQATAATSGQIGGEIAMLNGDVRILFTPAMHSATIEESEGQAHPGMLHTAGTPAGIVIAVKDGPTIYHTGDTDAFADMSLISHFRAVDVMMVSMGDKFTMGPDRAALAVKWVKPTMMIIPMHFGTYPSLSGTPAALEKALKAEGVKTPMREMKAGETLTL